MNQNAELIQLLPEHTQRLITAPDQAACLVQMLPDVLPIELGCVLLWNTGQLQFAAGYKLDADTYSKTDQQIVQAWVDGLITKGQAGPEVLSGKEHWHIFAPMQVGERLLGGIYGQFSTQQPTPIDALKQTMAVLASTAALVIDRQRLIGELKQANSERAKFISTVSHELRTPMTAIKGYTDLLRQGAVGPVSEIQVNFLNTIRNNVDRMSGLVSDLSDMGRLQSGRMHLEVKVIHLQSCVDAAAQTMRQRMDEKMQVLLVDIPADLPSVLADANRVNQVLGILLHNAHRYSPAEKPVKITAQRLGELVRVDVQDQGVGIQPHDQAHLFEAFFRSEDALVREHQGWGLSLHISSLLVQQMGGVMGASSTYGNGSTFWFTLPVARIG